MDKHCLFIGMKVKTQSWGNSLGVRIPAPIARETLLDDGSEVDLQLENGCIILTPVKRMPRYDLKKLTDKISARNLPGADADVWGAPTGKEIW